MLRGRTDGLVATLNAMTSGNGPEIAKRLLEFVTPCYEEHVAFWKSWIDGFDELTLPASRSVILRDCESDLDHLVRQLSDILEEVSGQVGVQPLATLLPKLLEDVHTGLQEAKREDLSKLTSAINKLDDKLATEYDPSTAAKRELSRWFYRHRWMVKVVLWSIVLVMVIAVLKQAVWLGEMIMRLSE